MIIYFTYALYRQPQPTHLPMRHHIPPTPHNINKTVVGTVEFSFAFAFSKFAFFVYKFLIALQLCVCVRVCVLFCCLLYLFYTLALPLSFLYFASRCRPWQTRKKTEKKSYKTLCFFFWLALRRPLKLEFWDAHGKFHCADVCVCNTCVCVCVQRSTFKMSPWPQRATAAASECVPKLHTSRHCLPLSAFSLPSPASSGPTACQIISENCLWRRVCPSVRLSARPPVPLPVRVRVRGNTFTSTAMSPTTPQRLPMPLPTATPTDSLRPDEPYEMRPDSFLTHTNANTHTCDCVCVFVCVATFTAQLTAICAAAAAFVVAAAAARLAGMRAAWAHHHHFKLGHTFLAVYRCAMHANAARAARAN